MVTKSATFCQWTFNTDLMNVIKYRLLKLKQAIDSKIQSSKEDKFICKSCNKEFDQMEIYKNNYKCPFDDKPLEKKKKECTNPEKLRKESNRIFVSFENSMKLLEDFKIPREFFGFEPLNKPNFNLPENITVQGFKNHFSHFKEAPTVKVLFDTLKTDVYKDSGCFKEDKVEEAEKNDPTLFSFYMNKTKNKLTQMVKNMTKKTNKRKKKELRKKLLESPDYEQMYKQYWTKVYDIF